MNEKSRAGWNVMLVSGLLYLAGAVGSQAQGVPLEINYQGVLTAANGQPVAGDNLTVNFRIFDAEWGGTMIWGERQLVTTDSNGVFDVLIGDAGEDVPGATNQVDSLPEVFSGVSADKRWLEVEVVYNLTAAMSPRQRFATVPYAYQAGNVAGSRGDFTVGSVLSVTSNAYLQGSLNLTDSGQEVLVFNDSVYNSAGLTVSQKMVVAIGVYTTKVDGAFTVHGNAIFSNDTAFTQSVKFDGPAYFTNGVSLRGNTAAFGSFRQLAAKGPNCSECTDTGTIQTNGFLIVRMITSNKDSNNTLTFTLNPGSTFEFKANWDTDGYDTLNYQDMCMFPVQAGTTWIITTGNSDNIGYVILYRSIP